MKIFIGADHRGFRLKEELKIWLVSQSHEVVDKGNTILDPEDDFPDFAAAVSEAVALTINDLRLTNNDSVRGILICGSGSGVSVLANKLKGIRCAIGFTADQIKASRNDDDINVLALPADFLAIDQAQNIVKMFLETPFSSLERHLRRLQKIQSIENQNFK